MKEIPVQMYEMTVKLTGNFGPVIIFFISTLWMAIKNIWFYFLGESLVLTEAPVSEVFEIENKNDIGIWDKTVPLHTMIQS